MFCALLTRWIEHEQTTKMAIIFHPIHLYTVAATRCENRFFLHKMSLRRYAANSAGTFENVSPKSVMTESKISIEFYRRRHDELIRLFSIIQNSQKHFGFRQWLPLPATVVVADTVATTIHRIYKWHFLRSSISNV